MQLNKLPYTFLGLLGITLCLVGVLTFQSGNLQASLEANAVDNQINNLIAKSNEAVIPEVLPNPVIVEEIVVPPQVEAIPTIQVAALNLNQVLNEANQPTSSVGAVRTYDCSLGAYEKENYKFEVLTPEVSYQVQPGEAFSTIIYIQNVGTNNWCGELTNREEGRLRLGTSLPQDRASQLLSDSPYRINMQAPEGIILPGETAAFTVNGIAPQTSGIYREFFSPVSEGVSWFPDVKISLDVYVGEYTQSDIEKLYYLQRTGNTNEFNLDDLLTVNIDISSQTEHVYKGNKLIHSYLISSGAYKTPTPLGVYEIYNKQELRIAGKAPYYRMPYWIGLKRPGGNFRGYGLHALPYLGNNKNASYFWKEAISHLGIRVSHGCVRRSDNDAEWLWTIAKPENTKIEVFASFDPSTFVADGFQAQI